MRQSTSLVLALTTLAIGMAKAGELPIPGFRPPAIPFITSDPYTENWIHGNTLTSNDVVYWDGMSREMKGLIQVDGTQTYRWLGTNTDLTSELPEVTQQKLTVYPTRTIAVSEIPNLVRVTVTSFTPIFAKELEILARPATYVTVAAESLDGAAHDITVYFDVTGRNAVNLGSTSVTYSAWAQGGLVGARIGSAKQKLFNVKGDHVGIDWGYANLAVSGASGRAYCGPVNVTRAHFIANGALPAEAAAGTGSAEQSLVAATVSLGKVTSGSAVFVYAYDDIKSIKYYGKEQEPYWRQQFASIEALMVAAASDYAQLSEKAVAYDTGLLSDLAAKGGDKYATVCAIAYRQAFATIKVTWNEDAKSAEVYLKEISSNGDMQTVDVVYPASPAFIYTNPRILELLLVPMLRFANNDTETPYTEPYSPHEIGLYPVADHTTSQQEKMPMENTGNMFLMIQGILRANGGDASFFYPRYWPMLTTWADYLAATLPFPENQLCTDDFTGRLANNTNLAAKGIVALAAFADICDTVTKGTAAQERCEGYRKLAKTYAKTWKELATVESGDMKYTAISFNKMDKWSIKYNLLWQKILKMGDTPFENFDEFMRDEVKWYISKINEYGTPMDSRHSYTKLDWLAWASFMAEDDASYNKLFDTVYKFAHETSSRYPLCDLYYTKSALPYLPLSFIARPVVGAVFAKALL